MSDQAKPKMGRTYIMTHNNPAVDHTVFLTTMFNGNRDSIRYIVGQLEQGAQGTPHI